MGELERRVEKRELIRRNAEFNKRYDPIKMKKEIEKVRMENEKMLKKLLESEANNEYL